MRNFLQIMADISIDEAAGQDWDLVVSFRSIFLYCDDECDYQKNIEYHPYLQSIGAAGRNARS